MNVARWQVLFGVCVLGCSSSSLPSIDGSGSRGGAGGSARGGGGGDGADGGDPGGSGFPDDTNTGPATARCGPLEDAVARTLGPADEGIVIANKRFSEGFLVQARNVTIRCCEIAGVSLETALVHAVQGDGERPDGLTIEDSSIHGSSADAQVAGALVVEANQVSIRRSNFFFARTGIQVTGGNVLIEDNYVHDLGTSSGQSVTGIVSRVGAPRITVRHNTIFNPAATGPAFALRHDDAPDNPTDAAFYSDTLVERNRIGGGSHAVDVGAVVDGLIFPGVNVSFRENVISTLFFAAGGNTGPVTGVPPEGNGYTWDASNVWLDGDAAAAPIVP